MLARSRLLVVSIVVPTAMALLAATSCTPATSSSSSETASDPETASGSDGDEQGGADRAADEGRSAVLIRVIDGDSLELEIDGVETEVRLLGVNAPELFRETLDGPDLRACTGELASEALKVLLEGEAITVVGSEIDRFGRLLAEVFAGSRSTTVDMIELGWGLAAGGADDDLWDRMEAAADGQLGMWGDLCGVPLADGLIIGRTQVNPPGPDGDRLNEEWVTIVNDGPDPVDLAGWEIRDNTTSNRFPLRSVLQPGAELRVRTGAGSSADGEFYLGERFPVWSNGGETVLLTDPLGVVTAWAFIDPT